MNSEKDSIYFRKTISFWNIAATFLPIFLGFVFYFIDTEVLPDAPTRVLIGLVAGVALQFKGIDAGFKEIVDEVSSGNDRVLSDVKDEIKSHNSKLLEEVSQALAISSSAIKGDVSTSNALQNIVGNVNQFDESIIHLTPNIAGLTKRWRNEYISSVERDIRSFADSVIKHNNDFGMDADMRLVKNAESTILATTIVSERTMKFWRSSRPGREYREHCCTFPMENRALRIEEDTKAYKGIGRIFIVGKDILDRFDDDNASAKHLMRNAVSEASEQASLGMSVRLLDDPELIDPDKADLDILIVDNCISSTTVKYDLETGVPRKVEVSWREKDIQNHILDWRLLWNKAMSLEEFCEHYGLSKEPSVQVSHLHELSNEPA